NKTFSRVRKRSISNVLNEMEYALSNGFKSFSITDDHFFAFTLEEIGYFSSEYNKRIKRPFSIVGLNPNNFREKSAEEKLKLLVGCGLTDIRIGIQSGSDKILNIFKRGYRAEEIPELLLPIDRNRKTIWNTPHDRLHVGLDFICDAVWETKEDKIATIKLAQRVLKQYSIFFYTLIYLPGTEIYDLVFKDGLIKDRVRDIYMRGIAGVDDNIYNRLFFLIAVTKERGINLSEELIGHILGLSDSEPVAANEIINSIISCIVETERHHNVNIEHAALYPYLTGFTEWTKKTGELGRKVLFRSYHQPYG
ncbi:MAG: radical SAM protein, partial [Candidatus Omnitrophota bacterium]